jgi:hypothetical protein
MQRILLLGAGFSRNWGGWLATEAFDYLLGCPEVVDSAYLRDKLWKYRTSGGFEAALAAVNLDYYKKPAPHLNHMLDLNSAIKRMFDDMNRGFFDLTTLELSALFTRAGGVRGFLARFDAIFTLNQDLLLEAQYFAHDVSIFSDQRWTGAVMPGMLPCGPANQASKNDWGHRDWVPSKKDEDYIIAASQQPFCKLHGSSNWQAGHGGPLLIVGNNKEDAMKLHPVLLRYMEEFERRLAMPGARLMVIGYGYRDQHINDCLQYAVETHGLRIFNISPDGAEAAQKAAPNAGARGRKPTAFEQAFQKGLMGASCRGLAEIFGHNAIEHEKIMRFFENDHGAAKGSK